MQEPRELRLIPDWRPLRQLVASHLGKTEDEIQAMADGGESLDQVELIMAKDEVLAKLRK